MTDLSRVAISEVGSLIADPKGYRRLMESAASQPRRFSKMQCLRLSCYFFHKPNQDFGTAQEYLETMFLKNFTNTDDLSEHVMLLQQYVEEFEKLGNSAIRCRDRIKIELPAKLAGSVRVSGEISRVDLTEQGYSVWMIGRGFGDWKEDLRFPVLQGFYADSLAAPIDEVSVGVYDFESGHHESAVFEEAIVISTMSQLEHALSLAFD